MSAASIQAHLKELRIELIDKINECQDFDEDEPDTFNHKHFTNLQLHAKLCADECITMMSGVRVRILQDNLRSFQLDEKDKDDRAQLSSMKQRKPVPPASPTSALATSSLGTCKPTLSIQTPSEPVMPKSPWAIDRPAEFSISSPFSPSTKTSQPYPSRDIPPASESGNQQPRLIPKEIVNYRLSANEEFLERRRQSRIMFQKEFRQSVSSIDENRVSQAYSISPTRALQGPATTVLGSSADRNRLGEYINNGPVAASPVLGGSRTPTSPIDGVRSRANSSGYDVLLTRERSQGGSQGSRDSRPTSQNAVYNLQRTSSEASQESIFGLRAAPLSPPLSDRSSGADNGGTQTQTLARTLQLPGFGEGVEPGIEVVSPVDRDNEKMLAYEDKVLPQTPAASVRSIDHPMRHDSSFYKFGGFCEGSKAILVGEAGLKKFKRPLV